MKRGLVWAIPLVAVVALSGAITDYESARGKIDSIEADRLKPGSRVDLTPRELTAYARHEAPAGVRDPQLEVRAPDTVTGSALVDFNKVQRARGSEPGWLMSRLLDGERPVSVTARIRSSGGRATVDVQRVSIGGLEIEGATLDFLIQKIVIPLYPDAVIGKPFEFGHHIERLDLQPKAVSVIIGR